MTTVVAPRLPGVTFEVPPRRPWDVLPRMDVAGFVGFASSGPVDVPVAVESPARFREIFGRDLALAREPVTGRTVHSCLGQAVEAFFRSGGLRCWVVRVAAPRAPARFEVPGLVSLHADRSRWSLGRARARSQGSWSDDLRVGLVANSRWLATPSSSTGAPPTLDPGAGRLRLAVPGDAVPGDVLRVSVPGREGALVVAVAEVHPSPSPGVRIVGWDPEEAWWLLSEAPSPEPAGPTGVFRLGADGAEPIEAEVKRVPRTAGVPDPSTYRLVLFPPSDLTPGDVVRVDRDGRSLLLSVRRRAPSDADAPGEVAYVASPGWLVARGTAPPGDGWWSEPEVVPAVERLSVDLLVWRGETLEARIDDLGLTPEHPASWARLPGDEALFRSLADQPGEGGPNQPSGVALRPRLPDEMWREAFSPRFPLATEREMAGTAEGGGVVWLPVGVPSTPDPAVAWLQSDASVEDSALERNGLDAFGPGLFVDPGLGLLAVGEVARTANDRAFLTRPPVKLRGLHALFSIEEVTLASVPDAVHPRWARTEFEQPEVVPAPVLEATVVGPDVVVLSWTQVPGATEYRLEGAEEPGFEAPEVRYRGPESEVALHGFGDCPARRFFRVRALRRTLAGPWSNTEEAVLPEADFEDCDAPIGSPRLDVTAGGSPPGELVWTPLDVDRYEVETAPVPDFSRETETFEASVPEFLIDLEPDVSTFVRVRGVREAGAPPGDGGPAQVEVGRAVGAWSNTVALLPPPEAVWTIVPQPEDVPAEDLLTVQRSLLRLCAARGDVLAVLSLPAGYRGDQAVEHVAQLAPWDGPKTERRPPLMHGVPPLTMDEAMVLGFGALYHPWVSVRVDGDEGPEIRAVPPEGGVCGRIARRAIARGVWIAPANEVVPGALGLDPPLVLDDQARLLARGVSILRIDPRGSVIAGSDTLSTERSLRPINVRRLLILIRRLVLRQAVDHVFQLHDRALRNLIVRRFESVLGDLFLRGAFAGRVPDEGFRVVSDGSNNPPESIDRGRLVVDLMVAPSEPMKFILVRLVQTAPTALVVEEV